MNGRAIGLAATIGLVIATLGVGPAAADLGTARCLTETLEEPLHGDGIWIGDAPDDRALATARSNCYYGKLTPYEVEPVEETGSDDRDVFRLEPVVGIYAIHVEAHAGCGNATIRQPEQGWTSELGRLCADGHAEEDVGILGGVPVHLVLDDGNMTYSFWYE